MLTVQKKNAYQSQKMWKIYLNNTKICQTTCPMQQTADFCANLEF